MRNLRAALLVVLIPVLAGEALAQTWQGPAAVGVAARGRKGGSISGAVVTLRYQGIDPVDGPPAVATDTKGRAVLAGLAEGEWQLEVRHEDFLSYIAVISLQAGKKASVSASFLQAGGRSLVPMKVSFFRATGRSPSRGVAQAQPVPEPAPSKPPAPAAKEEPARPAESRPEPTPAPVTVPARPASRQPEPTAAPTAQQPEKQTKPAPAPVVEPEPLEPAALEPPPADVTPLAPPETVDRPAESAPPATAPPPVPEAAPTPSAEPPPVAEVSPAAPTTPPSQQVDREPEPQPVQEPPTVQVTPAKGPPAPAPVESPSTPPADDEPEQPTPEPEPAVPTRVPEPGLPEPAEQPQLPEESPVPTPAPQPVEPEPVQPPAEPAPVQPPAEPAPIQPPAEQPPETAPAPEDLTPQQPEPSPLEEIAPSPPAEVVTEPVKSVPMPQPPVQVQEQTPVAESPAPVPSRPAIPAPARREPSLGSAAEGTCIECQASEWSVSSSQVAGAFVEGTPDCNEAIGDAFDDVMATLSRSIHLELSAFAGPVADGSPSEALKSVSDGEAADLRGALAKGPPHCRAVAVVIPRAARFVGFRYSAADHTGSGGCLPGQPCDIGQARWLDRPRVLRGPSSTVIWGLFQNLADDRERRAGLTVFFRPPGANWRPPVP